MSSDAVGNESENGNLAASVGANHPQGVVLSLPHGDNTGSVVSAMTEHDATESLNVPHIVMDLAGTTLIDSDVPSQVILSTEHEHDAGIASGTVMQVILPERGSEIPPLIVSMPPAITGNETASCPPATVTGAAASSSFDIEVSSNSLGHASTPVVTDTANRRDIDYLDEYIRSPEVQNAIVERSPGGRYVRFLEKLGSGASKDVYRAYDTQEGIEVAWNVFSLSGVPKAERNRLVNEVRLLERLHHQNIISFHGSWVNRERLEVIFVTEILSSGTLKSFINKVQLIRWKIAKRWATQILKGLEYLHSQDPPVIHRDLKAENIFINGTSGDLRIGDLGLSTVHRNGRVLSVLGTPEFMAPDMYETDGTYDVKVDIYAFGMVLLEIFTKEIPYSECTNPAQIYKKVSAGEPPEVLKRLESRHAREFVKLCLGYRDDAGNFIRPTATELLQHPFLEVREGLDDEEVLVRPSLRESTIYEAGETSSSATSPIATPSKSRPSQSVIEFPSTADMDDTQADERSNTPLSRTVKQPLPSRDFDEDEDGDRFDEMPESETNMKKIKVLMGRELDDNSHELRPESTANRVESKTSLPSHAVVHSVPLSEGAKDDKQYLVAAAVVGPLDPDTRPYPDDILKLVVTLPVDGQAQNVQFDFHLIEDDPVQVAKEMVHELDIPTDAILEISQTISGLARTARMQVEAFNVRSEAERKAVEARTSAFSGLAANHIVQSAAVGQPQFADPMQIPQQAIGPPSHVVPGVEATLEQNPPFASVDPQSNTGGTILQGTDRHVTQPRQVIEAQTPQQLPMQISQVGLQLLQQRQMAHDGMVVQPLFLLQEAAPTHVPPSQPRIPTQAQPMQSGQPLQPYQAMSAPLQPHLQHAAVVSMQVQQPYQEPMASSADPISTAHSQSSQSQQPAQIFQAAHAQLQHQEQLSPHVLSQAEPPQAGAVAPPLMAIHSQAQHSQFMRAQSIPLNGESPAPLLQDCLHARAPPSSAFEALLESAPLQSLPSEVLRLGDTAATTHGTIDLTDDSLAPGQPTGILNPSSVGSNGEQSASAPFASIDDDAAKSRDVEASAYPMPEGYHGAIPKLVERSGTAGSHMDSTFASSPSMNGSAGPVSPDGSESADIDSVNSDAEMDEELRKLEEEHKKNMQRTMKVFGNRMETLSRTIAERDAQHRILLEKHEKEKFEYQRRLAQEEEQQTRRLEQLQKEWEKKRDELAERRRVEERAVNASLSGQRQDSPVQVLEASDRSQERSVSQMVSQVPSAITGSVNAQPAGPNVE